MSCDRDREILGELVAGALSPAEEREVFGHVETCERCRSELAQISALEGRLARLGANAPSFTLARGFVAFLREEKLAWLVPLVVTLLAVGGLLVFAEGSAIAPFIYSIF